MNDFIEQTEIANTPPAIINGLVSDFDLLPKDLGMSPRSESVPVDDIPIKLGALEFDYTQVKQEVSEGKSKLRLMKNNERKILGFTIITPDKSSSTIRMFWVNPQYRGMKLGENLLQDAIQILPPGIISMDIWGGEPMVKLATKFGFHQNPGGNMTNRYTFQKG